MATGNANGGGRSLSYPVVAGLGALAILALVLIAVGLLSARGPDATPRTSAVGSAAPSVGSATPSVAGSPAPTATGASARSFGTSPASSATGAPTPSEAPSRAASPAAFDPLLEGLLTESDLPGLGSPSGAQEGTEYDIDDAAFEANGGVRVVSRTWQSLADTGVAAVFDIRMQFPTDEAAAAYLAAAEPVLSERSANGQSPIPSAPVIGEDSRVYGLEQTGDQGPVLLRTYLFHVGPVAAKIVAGGPGVTAATTDAIAAAAAERMRAAGPPAAGSPRPAGSVGPSPTPAQPLPTGDALAALLLEHVPPEIGPSCVPDTQRLWTGELATLVCTDDSQDVTVTYSGFDSVDSLEAAFDASMQGIDLGDVAPSCDQGPYTGAYQVEGEDVGNVTCWDERGGQAIMWSDDRLAILSVAASPTLDAAGLYLWWQGAGPAP